MSYPKRGEIYWVDIPEHHSVGREQFKQRPFVVVSCNQINSANEIVVGVPLSTRTAKKNRNHRILIPASDMVSSPTQKWKPQDSIALTEQLRALSLERFEQPRIGKLTPRALAAIELGIAYVLDLP